MKKSIFKSAFIIILAITTISFTTLSDKKVNVDESKITWKGYKVTGAHEGTITLKEGTLIFNGKDITGGNFIMDMTTINVTDIEGGSKGNLEGHLKSADFFAVDSHPTASFTITKVEGKGSKVKVTGNLVIRGKSNSVTFDMTVNENSATAFLKIDRTKFGIEYNSSNFFENLKDKAIYDEFDLNVNLKF